jgi:outer membrane protein OmpA-like peptidoglycan-associated protein/tetratricopeptide (TPR) repeat protein
MNNKAIFNKKRVATLLFLCMLCFVGKVSMAQSVPFSKEAFPIERDQLKDAKGSIKDGDFQMDYGNYFQALEHYLGANEFNSNNAELNYKIGICYLGSELRYKCSEYFSKAFQLDRNVSADIHLMLGRGLHLNNKFTAAINEYKAYLSVLSADDLSTEGSRINKLIKECEIGNTLNAKEQRAFVDNLGLLVNSKYNDHSPLITADESNMVFTSTRENGRKISGDGQFDEDIYISYKKAKEWQAPKSMGELINTQFNDATVGLSPDGQQLLIYNGNRGNGDIQICWLNGDDWNYPKSLPKEINSDYKETAACFSPDGNKLYFISDRPGGIGGSDIYYSKLNSKGKWGDAINLGSVVNSIYNEETVFMHPDGRTLYFSSEGHNSTGGFDVFVAHMREDGSWTKPENLGYPVNSPDDDLCFVISANGRRGYCSSVRPDSHGGFDVYQMTFLGPEKPIMLTNEDNLIAVRNNPVSNIVMEESVELKTIRLTIVKGFVKDMVNNEPVFAQIDIVDNEKNEVIFSSKTNSVTGRFLVSLPSGKNYGLIVNADEYLFHSENFNIPQATEYQEIEKNIALNSMKKDVKIVLKNVFFETSSSKLKPTSYAELGRLTLLLNENPTLKIEISGHTDNQGGKAVNLKLSKDRAKAVVDFLVTEGVSTERLDFKGYAFNQPIADNATKEGRSQNRRVEFKVLSN